jgi:hypothetical protein
MRRYHLIVRGMVIYLKSPYYLYILFAVFAVLTGSVSSWIFHTHTLSLSRSLSFCKVSPGLLYPQHPVLPIVWYLLCRRLLGRTEVVVCNENLIIIFTIPLVGLEVLEHQLLKLDDEKLGAFDGRGSVWLFAWKQELNWHTRNTPVRQDIQIVQIPYQPFHSRLR